MRVTRATLAVVVATVGAAAPASSQRRGSVELGAFGQYTMFGDVLRLDNAVGGGAGAGLFIVRDLAVEGGLSFSHTVGPLGDEITYRPWRLRLGYHIPLTPQLRIPVGLGYTKGIYDGAGTSSEHEDAVGGVLGVEYYIKPSWVLNVEALFDRFASAAKQETGDTKGYWNNSIRAGVSWIYPPVEQCTLAIDPPNTSVTQGDSRTFTATARGERTGKTCPGTVTFASTDNAISRRGIYTPSTPGQATITASYRGRGQRKTANANVTVNRAAPTPSPDTLPSGPCIKAILIRPDTATVLRGETVQIHGARAHVCRRRFDRPRRVHWRKCRSLRPLHGGDRYGNGPDHGNGHHRSCDHGDRDHPRRSASLDGRQLRPELRHPR